MGKETKTMGATKIIATLTAALCLTLALAANASASIGIESFTTSTSTTQAGGHPDLSTSFALEAPGAPESARNVTFDAPEGIFGNVNAIAACTSSDFALTSCPPNSQAGLATIRANYEADSEKLLGTAPIYHVQSTDPGVTALFGLNVPTIDVPILIPVSVRTAEDYGLRFKVAEITQLAPLRSADLTFWGFPGLSAHNPERFPKGSAGNPAGCPGLADASCNPSATKTSEPVRPLTSNPSTCTPDPLPTTLTVQSYQDPANPTSETSSYDAVEGCEKVTFDPVLLATPTTKETDSPTGLDLILRTPQPQNFSVTPSAIKQATVTLPAGLTINPDAADGQGACTDAEASFGTDDSGNCPDSAKIGTFEIGSPTLPGPLEGDLFIGEPRPAAQYRVFMIASGFGINAKLAATFHPDPITGQVRIETQELPQVPFEEFALHLFASDRGLLATPTHCSGAYVISGHFFPWNEEIADQTSTQNFGLDSGPGGKQCPAQVRPFSPRLAAGTSNPLAGAFSDFAIKLDRDDGDQFLGDLNFAMPPGFTGDLRGISYCPEASIAQAAQRQGRSERAQASCPASSSVGSTNVAAGPGTHPFNAAGKIYLAGPLKGAPLSLVAITPALAGPYDYGNVVVRVALGIDPLTAQVRALSERMPQVIGGIPIRMRSIRVSIDRPNFTINPTNCTPMAVQSQGVGDQGTISEFSSPFTAVNCSTLPFAPKMAVRQLGKKRQAKRSKNPSLRFDLKTKPGHANIKSLAVTLPKSFAIDQEHLGNICSKAQLEAERCKGRQPIGSAWVKTPLLDAPLSGPAYAVSGYGRLPHLVFILDGQVTIMPQAESSSVRNGHLRTVVPVIPDAPIGHFRLTLLGAKQGYLENTRDLCKSGAGKVEVSYLAQSGKTLSQRVAVGLACGKGKRSQR